MKKIAVLTIFLLAGFDRQDAANLKTSSAYAADIVIIHPQEYPRALRNPHMGFTNRGNWENNEWATLMHSYIKWNEIERDSLDGIDEIKEWCDRNWAGVELRNIKVIPRVYLHWDGDQKYWPADMKTDDYTSEQFKRRLKKMIWKLGRCWDTDPRVAHIEMGIIGKWGEHHSPSPTLAIQKLLGEEFRKNFPHKKVLVRHPWEFKEFEFGIYWDSWAHWDQMQSHGEAIYNLGDRWKNEIIGGEVAYNWGNWKIQPGDDPTDTMIDPQHRNFLIATIRRLHCTQLRWVADYDQNNAAAKAGGELVQKAFGYRFVIDEVSYPSRIDKDEEFTVMFTGRNVGSAPFYYDWPVQLSLLNQANQVVWSADFSHVDIRTWLPVDKWDENDSLYSIPPPPFTAADSFKITESLKPGVYKLAIAVLDPAGRLPSLRFAIKNYAKGGRHPIGNIGFGVDLSQAELDPSTFDDPYTDKSLRYVYDPALIGIPDNGEVQLPQSIMLLQNYPNPFNSSTAIPYELSMPMLIKLSVFNLLGQHVITLVDEFQHAGYHVVNWDGKDAKGIPIASGVYFSRLETYGYSVQTKKVVLK
ncbi:MAG: DUF4832 domain-containing protein [candidate division KSB1 bacterium]|nr:DUF4832 domain-containing protein [candidate division KSB1 bacterium]